MTTKTHFDTFIELREIFVEFLSFYNEEWSSFPGDVNFLIVHLFTWVENKV